uniref:Uncharacterized protein n=1 Tax=Cucumis melo TaxID=3656 RepID=A0A9I9E2W3_CUCME
MQLTSFNNLIHIKDFMCLPIKGAPVYMHKVSSELEILGRHQHPNLTGPFLKDILQVAEIARVSKHESNSLPSKAASYTSHVKSLISNGEKQAGGVSRSGHDDDINISSLESGFAN